MGESGRTIYSWPCGSSINDSLEASPKMSLLTIASGQREQEQDGDEIEERLIPARGKANPSPMQPNAFASVVDEGGWSLRERGNFSRRIW